MANYIGEKIEVEQVERKRLTKQKKSLFGIITWYETELVESIGRDLNIFCLGEEPENIYLNGKKLNKQSRKYFYDI